MKLQIANTKIMKDTLLAFLAVGLLVGPMAVQAAPGGVTEGLKVWLRADVGISANDGEAVEVWADQSGEGNDAVFNPANVFDESPPVFDASNPGVAGRPTIRFNNVSALEIDLGFLVGSDYTVFVVNGRDRTGLANFYIAGDSAVSNTNLVLGYETVTQLRQSHFSNDLNAVVSEYVGTELWQMDTFTFDQTVGRTIYQDGVPRASDTNLVPLAANSGTTIGHFRAFGNLYWFQGDLAEIVIYDRALSGAERRAVEAELGDMYGLPYGLFEGLCDGTANSSVTCDPATGLEWLDLTSTLGLSGDDFQADVGGWRSAGWLWGTSALVDQLLVNAGATNLDGTTNQLGVVQNLLNLLGTTFADSNVETALAIADNEDGTISFPQFNKAMEVGSVFGSTIACCGSTSDSLEAFGIWAYRFAGSADEDNDGVDNELDLCPNTLPGDAVDANGCTADQAANSVFAEIFTLIDSPVSDKARDKLSKAQNKLGDALAELAEGDVKKALQKVRDAVKELTKAEKEGAEVAKLIEQLVELARAQAQTAIDDAVASGGDPKKIEKAQKEVGKAQGELAKGKPDKAIEKFAKAWEHANKSQS